MGATKSPISILQEFAVMKNWSIPIYKIVDVNYNFCCTVFVGPIETSEEAPNKKMAKHLCAERALKLLQLNLGIASENTTSENNVTRSRYNAVGKLNEMCMQNGRITPDYNEIGIHGQDFVIQCQLLFHVTEGRAATKKEAKQEAAQKMLAKAKTEHFQTSLTKLIELKTKKDDEFCPNYQETIVNLYKKLSLNNKRNDNLFSLDENESLPNILIQEYQKLCKNENVSEIELRNVLKRANIKYKIEEFCKQPLVLVLKIIPNSNSKSYTFIGSSDTYSETVIELLRKAISGCIILNN